MQPTAQAVGEQNKISKPQRGERATLPLPRVLCHYQTPRESQAAVANARPTFPAAALLSRIRSIGCSTK